jgi:mono/diheme cytochrome c family protein
MPVAMLLLLLGLSARAADPGAVARGAYLAAAAGCDQCHTATTKGARRYAGGRVLRTSWGLVATPNIGPDRSTGIGGWRFADFARALRWGIAPDDTHYLPIFPFPFYNRLTATDLADLWAFLRSLPPVREADRAGGSGVLTAARMRAAVAVVAETFPGPWRPDPAHDAAWNRGAYLVATVGRCGDCHTPRDWLGARAADRFLAGAVGGPGGKIVPDITPDRASGIGTWRLSDILALLKDGQTPDFDFVGGAMAEIVRNTSRLDDADRRAIAIYLQAIPAVAGPKKQG